MDHYNKVQKCKVHEEDNGERLKKCKSLQTWWSQKYELKYKRKSNEAKFCAVVAVCVLCSMACTIHHFDLSNKPFFKREHTFLPVSVVGWVSVEFRLTCLSWYAAYMWKVTKQSFSIIPRGQRNLEFTTNFSRLPVRYKSFRSSFIVWWQIVGMKPIGNQDTLVPVLL